MNGATRLFLAAATTVLALPATAMASDNETTFRIVAVVQPFCRITLASGEDGAETIDGQADFGPVRELCNTPGGYVVRAQFQNLVGGTLRTGGELTPISADGSVQFTSSMARLRVRDWSVMDLDDRVAQRVYMRVSISPL